MANRTDALDAPMRAAIASVAICGAALAFLALLFYGVHEAAGVLVGGLIATANLAAFARIGKAFLQPGGNKGPWVAFAFLKLTLLFGGCWLLLKHEVVSGIALAAGYGALPLGITLGTLFQKTPEEPSDPGPEN